MINEKYLEKRIFLLLLKRKVGYESQAEGWNRFEYDELDPQEILHEEAKNYLTILNKKNTWQQLSALAGVITSKPSSNLSKQYVVGHKTNNG